MTDRDIEKRLRGAIEKTAPDGLERLLSEVKNRKGVIKMEEKKRRNRWIGLVAAVLALALIGGAGGLYYRQNYAVATVVSLDVNPSIELNVNRSEKVISCSGLNDEGREILSSMNGGQDLKGAKLSVAVNAVVGAIVRAGYLDSLSSAILISVEDNDQTRGARLQAELVAEVDGVLKAADNSAGVLSQSMTADKGLTQQAQDNNISSGKAALVNKVLGLNPNLDFAALAQLSVEELRDLITIGAPAMPIGKEEAIRVVTEYSGIQSLNSVVDAVFSVDPELDDPVPHYEVELTWGAGSFEYDYKVDAFTGEVLYGENIGNLDPGTSTNPGTTTPGQPSSTDIGADAAKAAALRHAGLTENDVTFLKAERDYDDGRLVYEVDFYTADTEYDYEIDAATGEVLKHETEAYTGTQTPPSTTDIGKEAAQQAALSKAGITDASSVTWLKCQREYDDGRLEYDIEFVSGGTEYDVTVDAATGNILKYETEPYSGTQTGTQNPPSTTDIGKEAAQQAALNKAGIIDASSVTWLKCQREYDDGRLEYDIEFVSGGTEYDVTVDAATGNVLKYETEPHSGTQTGTQNPPSTADVGKEAAQQAALNKAGITDASSVTWLKCQREYDDGRLEYDIEFVSGGTEYDVTVDAATGNILKYETETRPGTQTGGSTGDIGSDKAVETALAHAGVAKSDARNIKAERDWDDGRLVYEVEFKSGNLEYEYKIDASTGAILEHESDRD